MVLESQRNRSGFPVLGEGLYRIRVFLIAGRRSDLSRFPATLFISGKLDGCKTVAQRRDRALEAGFDVLDFDCAVCEGFAGIRIDLLDDQLAGFLRFVGIVRVIRIIRVAGIFRVRNVHVAPFDGHMVVRVLPLRSANEILLIVRAGFVTTQIGRASCRERVLDRV